MGVRNDVTEFARLDGYTGERDRLCRFHRHRDLVIRRKIERQALVTTQISQMVRKERASTVAPPRRTGPSLGSSALEHSTVNRGAGRRSNPARGARRIYNKAYPIRDHPTVSLVSALCSKPVAQLRGSMDLFIVALAILTASMLPRGRCCGCISRIDWRRTAPLWGKPRVELRAASLVVPVDRPNMWPSLCRCSTAKVGSIWCVHERAAGRNRGGSALIPVLMRGSDKLRGENGPDRTWGAARSRRRLVHGTRYDLAGIA